LIQAINDFFKYKFVVAVKILEEGYVSELNLKQDCSKCDCEENEIWQDCSECYDIINQLNNNITFQTLYMSMINYKYSK
jgi:hypothetical protein